MAADLPSRADLLTVGRGSIVSNSSKISVDQVNTAGSDVNLFVGVGAVLAFQVIIHLGFRIAALYLDSAEGEDLDRLAKDRYDLLRKGASSSFGGLTFFRTSIAAGGGSVPIGTQVFSRTGQTYVTTSVAAFGSTSLTATANFKSAQAGIATKVGANGIFQVQQPGLLFDPTIQVTNLLPSAGGEDAEDDDSFKERIRGFWAAARRGTLGAIVQGALATPGVASAQAIEVLEGVVPARVVQLFISDSAGIGNVQLGKTVLTNLDEYRAAGIPVVAVASVPQIVPITLHFTFGAAVDTDSLTTTILAAVTQYVNSLRANETLTRAGLGTVLLRFRNDGLVVDESSIVSPSGDIVPALGSTIRTTEALVTAQ